MRITRSTLRRLIAEESARLLREAAFPEEVEGVYGEAPPEDGGGDGIPKMLHIMYRGFRPVFIVTDVDANPMGEEAEDVTQQIQPAKSNMTTPELAQAIIDFITDPSNSIMYVFDEEMNDPETDDKFETEDYVEHLEGLIASSDEEAGTRGAEMYQRAGMSGEDEDLYEGKKGDSFMDYDPEEIPDMDDQYDPDYYEGLDDEEDIDLDTFSMGEPVPSRALVKRVKPNEFDLEFMGGEDEEGLNEGEGASPRARLKAYLKSKHANVSAVMKAIDAVLEQHHEADPDEDLGDPTSEDVAFRLPDSVLRYIPQKDSDLWHSMIDDVLNDEFDPTAAGEAAAYRKDIEDTERDLSHPSRFLEEGFFDMFKKTDPDSDGEDPDVDPLGDSDDAKHSRHMDYKHALKMGGGPDEEGFAIDYDTGRPSPFAAKHLPKPAPAAADIEGPEQDDPFADDPVLAAGRDADYEHAWKLGAKSDAEGFAADYDTGKKKKFPPASGGISEARWAKLAGILKG